MPKLVSVRIDEQTLNEAKRLKINFSEIMRESLKSEIEKRKEKELSESLSRVRKTLRGVDMNQTLEELRKDRDERR